MESNKRKVLFSMVDKRFNNDGNIYDDNNNVVTPINDDYDFYKSEQENLTNPLSDDYCKYNNE